MKNLHTTILFLFLAFVSFGQNEKTMAQFKVEGNCEMCEVRIEKAAKSVNGVKKADWDLKTKMISIKYDSTKANLDQIHKAIAEMGYKTEKVAAIKKGYDTLPFCCKVNGACDKPKD